MKIKLVAAAVMSFAVATSYAVEPTVATLSDKDKVSYSIGYDLGGNIKKQGIDINPLMMSKGIEDAVSGGKSLLTDEQMKTVLTEFQKSFMAKRMTEMKQKAESNQKKGDAFLEENKTKPGVVVLASGLQYKIIKAASGEKPGKDSTVSVDYTGHLISGEVFDTTEKGGKPATFKVSQVIPGWSEALQLMPAGSTWEIYVPAKLAYGQRSVGALIGPNETLVFSVHLISVKK